MRRLPIRPRTVLLAGIALLVAAQAIPYGPSRTNPTVVEEPQWDSPMTRELASRACFDCHSNETEWPVYSRIAPVSWLVARDVQEGRAVLNFSEWQRPQEEAGEAAKTVTEKADAAPAVYADAPTCASLRRRTRSTRPGARRHARRCGRCTRRKVNDDITPARDRRPPALRPERLRLSAACPDLHGGTEGNARSFSSMKAHRRAHSRTRGYRHRRKCRSRRHQCSRSRMR